MKRWGICFGPAWGTSIAELTREARLAEARGFDRIAIGEYHNDPLAWMHALAGVTHNIRVATTVLNVALRHPSVTAEAVAAIRDLHGDRVDLGLGLSHRRIVSEQLGLELLRLEDLAEYAAAVRASLEGRPFTGRRWRATPDFNRTRICAGAVPILAAALGQRAAKSAAAYADGVILTWTPHRQIARIAAVLNGAAADSMRPTPALWVVLPCLPAASYQQSVLAAAVHLRAYLELPSYRRMLEEAGFSAEVERASALAPQDGMRLAQAMGEQLLGEVAQLGGLNDTRQSLDSTMTRLRELGVTGVILYPLDAGAGWRIALERTLDELAPGT